MKNIEKELKETKLIRELKELSCPFNKADLSSTVKFFQYLKYHRKMRNRIFKKRGVFSQELILEWVKFFPQDKLIMLKLANLPIQGLINGLSEKTSPVFF